MNMDVKIVSISNGRGKTNDWGLIRSLGTIPNLYIAASKA